MNVISINSADQTAFRGLWGKSSEDRPKLIDDYIVNKIGRNYHAFADEADMVTKSKIAKNNYDILVPTENDNIMKRVISETKVADRLSFTKEQFAEYKGFYGKVLPERMKKIEQELVDKGLSHYVNNKTLSAIKRFLHNIRII